MGIIILGAFGTGKQVSANSNLDNLISTGLYSIMNSSQPATIQNKPNGESVGRIIVIFIFSVVIQVFFTYQPYKIYVRSFADNAENTAWSMIAQG